MNETCVQAATVFIAQKEDFRSAPYKDVADVWTQGYGFTYLPDGSRVTAKTPAITQAAAMIRLTDLVRQTMAKVEAALQISVSDNQLIALTSFAYNVGVPAFRRSTLLNKLNHGDINGAASQFSAWAFSGGHVVTGLINRRKAEAALFLTPDQKNPSESGSSEG